MAAQKTKVFFDYKNKEESIYYFNPDGSKFLILNGYKYPEMTPMNRPEYDNMFFRILEMYRDKNMALNYEIITVSG